MDRKITFGLISFMLVLVVFDAFQQKYYLDTFNLHPEGNTIAITNLLTQHLIRWTSWILVSAPIGYLVWRQLPKNHEPITNRTLGTIGSLIVAGVFLSLLLISFISITRLDISFTYDNLEELFVFFFYQKSLTFFISSFALVLLLYTLSKQKTIKSQFVEISNLLKKSSSLEEALMKSNKEEPHLNIKTGYKVNPIPLSEITWIQSDDYCVKIHTEDRTYSLRKSMKDLEDQLTPYGFIRVHRGALLNLHYLQQVNFDAAKIQLVNTAELPLSKSGAKTLKRKLKESAL